MWIGPGGILALVVAVWCGLWALLAGRYRSRTTWIHGLAGFCR